MELNNKPQPKFSFSQAVNFLREKKAKLANGLFRKEITQRVKDEAKISMALPQDRYAYLTNALKAFDEVTGHGERVFLRLTKEVPSHYSRKEIGHFLKQIMLARINGCSTYRLASMFKKPEPMIQALEELGKLELIESLKAKGFVDLIS